MIPKLKNHCYIIKIIKNNTNPLVAKLKNIFNKTSFFDIKSF